MSVEANQLLAALPDADYERLRPFLQPVPLIFRQVLFESRESDSYVYFPRSGLISLVTHMQDGRAAETGIVGNEGMVGLGSFLGGRRAAYQALVQVPGGAVRMATATLHAEADAGGILHDLLLRYTEAVLAQTAQVAACNALHSAEQRCARWLVTAQDRTGEGTLPFTQEFLANMLGVRRATVSAVLGSLQLAEFIRCAPGRITIVDRNGLQAISCECYTTIRRAFASLPGPENLPF